MRTILKLFTHWGIKFETPHEIEEKSARKVSYADKDELSKEIVRRNRADEIIENYDEEFSEERENTNRGGMPHTPIPAEKPRRKSAQYHNAPEVTSK